MRVIIPVRTQSETNMREHWGSRARRRKHQRETTRMLVASKIALLRERGVVFGGRLTIWLTRISPRGMDSDNLAGALKAPRDGVADAFGMDDGDPRLDWRWAQRRGRPGEHAVEVEVRG